MFSLNLTSRHLLASQTLMPLRVSMLSVQAQGHQYGKCLMARRFGSEDCASEAARNEGIDVPSLVDCMGDNDSDAEFPMLQVLSLLRLPHQLPS